MTSPGSVNLPAIARGVMQEHGFLVEFPPDALKQAEEAKEPSFTAPDIRDLSGWLWSSIDNDDSRDLDQLEFAREEPPGIRVYVAIAQVDPFLPKGTPLDEAARHNTTSVYTGVRNFPMLPERLSTNLTSLIENQKRLAIVFELGMGPDGKIGDTQVYPAYVLNQAQLTYDAAALWLDPSGAADVPDSEITRRMLAKIRGNPELQQQLKLQDQAAQALRRRRHDSGALTLQSVELQPRIHADGSVQLDTHRINRATQLIEDLMIASNQAAVQFLLEKNSPSLRRVVRVPKRWDRIVELAAQHGDTLPAEPDSIRLEEFLQRERARDPERFPDLSLAVIKLLGRGEYVILSPGQAAPGHFGLAVQNYSHSTAPNRRYPDVLTQRLILAALEGKPIPYSLDELNALAARCTQKEDDANKVERSVHKSIAAVALAPRIGEEFSGYITGSSEKGVFVRLLKPPVEGKVRGKPPRLDVGDAVRVRLVDTNPLRGYIDFEYVQRL